MIATKAQLRYTILLLANRGANRIKPLVSKVEDGQELSISEHEQIAQFYKNQQMYSNLLEKYRD